MNSMREKEAREERERDKAREAKMDSIVNFKELYYQERERRI